VHGVEILINLGVESRDGNEGIDNICQYVSIWWWICIPKKMQSTWIKLEQVRWFRIANSVRQKVLQQRTRGVQLQNCATLWVHQLSQQTIAWNLC